MAVGQPPFLLDAPVTEADAGPPIADVHADVEGQATVNAVLETTIEVMRSLPLRSQVALVLVYYAGPGAPLSSQ